MIVIFLDIDGVILHPRDKDRIQDQLKNKYAELKVEKSKQDFSSKACDQAAVDLFDKSALEKLNNLIATIGQRGESVGIVISSSWRENRSVSQLKILFQQYDFSKKIIGKTADSIQVTDKEIHFHRSLNRGEEIEVWLQQNKAQFQVTNFLIFDDVDSGMSELFKNNFVECQDGAFSQKDLSKSLVLCKQHPSDVKENYPVNKLNLTISNENGSECSIEGLLRLTIDKRKDFISSFFKAKTSLSQKVSSDKDKTCVDLIEEFDMGSASAEKSNCSIM